MVYLTMTMEDNRLQGRHFGFLLKYLGFFEDRK